MTETTESMDSLTTEQQELAAELAEHVGQRRGHSQPGFGLGWIAGRENDSCGQYGDQAEQALGIFSHRRRFRRFGHRSVPGQQGQSAAGRVPAE